MNQSQWDVIVYEEDTIKVIDHLKNGEVEYFDLSGWSYQDRFFAFLLGCGFFETCGSSYPTPRRKEEVPLWFLLSCALQMRLNGTGAYSKLPGLLKNGPILSRVKFNLGGIEGGFNQKNRYDRQCPVNFDTVRMPVDEHGQLIKMDRMTPEQRQAVKYHPCYTLSELLHVGKDDRCYVVARHH